MKQENLFCPTDNQKCNKCGKLIAFRKNKNNKWEPCELDGSDHWDICSANTPVTAAKKRLWAKMSKPILMKPSHNKPLYDGVAPPWD